MSAGDDATLTTHLGGAGRRRAKGAAALFVALEAGRPTAGASRHALTGIDTVALGRGRERGVERSRDNAQATLELRIPDGRMSGSHASIERVFGRWMLVDSGSKNGTLVNGTPVDRRQLKSGDLIEVGHTFLVFRDDLAESGEPLDLASADLSTPAPGLSTLLPDIAARFDRLCKVAATELPILIGGETGTGKELAARAAHTVSRRSGHFIAVNCGAIPETLAESELFGHQKGAFSGATADKPGHIHSASGGPLFLDEIGDLSLHRSARSSAPFGRPGAQRTNQGTH